MRNQTLTISIPAWAAWLVPLVIGGILQWLGNRDERRQSGPFGWGSMFPDGKTIVGCGLWIATAFVAVGFMVARCAK